MKKNLLASIVINVLLLILVALLFKEYSKAKAELCFFKEHNIVSEKNKDVIKIDKADPVYIYNSRKFPCDKDNGSGLGYAICTFERLQFADSLLNNVVKNRVKEFDDFIKRNKEGAEKAQDNTYFVNCLRINLAAKENFIKSQKVWEEMRSLNSEDVKLGCDGGSGCTGITNDAEIKYVLERIEKIKIGGPCF
ncbi:hypothetical protein ACHRVZ_03995 [Flavobacterium sp. FlaQc-57]|uniref:hypothetical protein n=1 Tax=Flavobacterium sp. FlaQc-57 TaxID=3374186 RepID=UPI003757587A